MKLDRPQRHVLRHLTAFFAGQQIDVVRWPLGPAEERIPGFAVARATAGRMPASEAHVGPEAGPASAGSRRSSSRFGDAVIVDAGRHHELEPVPDTVPIGEPWLNGSHCDHLLVPIPYGPDLEICTWRRGHARILWLIPITERERQFEMSHGVEALEQRFEAEGLEYWDSSRASIVEMSCYGAPRAGDTSALVASGAW